jgi:hypothetical protein
MAVLSNNGRLIVSLPVASQLQNTDQFIIQSVSNTNPNGVTKRATYGFLLNDLNSLILTNIQNTPTLKFSGSFYNPDGGVANFYTTRVRDGLTVTTGGITVSSGASSFQSVTATQFNGPLTGNVNASSILVSGTGNFGTIIVANTIAGNINSSGLSTFANLQMAGGIIGGTPGAITIDNSPIGNTSPSTIKGTSITGSLGLKSLLGLVVDSYAKITGTTYANGGLISNKISASLGLTGSLKGNLTGDVFSPTGVKVLENGTGLAKNALFYGSSSYALTSSRALTASYAFKSANIIRTTFALSSSYASSSRFSLSSSYASSSISSSYTFKTRFSLSSSYASSSKKSLTSSYVLQTESDYTNKLAYYDGTILTKTNDLKTDFSYPNRLLYFSGSPDPTSPTSIPLNNFMVIDGYDSPLAGPGAGQSCLALSLNVNRATRNGPSGYLPVAYNYGPEAWNFIVYNSGSLAIQSYKQSYSFSSSNYYIKTNTSPSIELTFSPIKFINNSIYFWGEPFSYNTAMRDGALGIGVPSHDITTGTSNLKAKLQIDVFSASYSDLGKGAWNGTAPVRNLPAILVRYGSGSLAKTFYVSGSGNTYIGGDCNINGNVTSSLDFRIEGDLTVVGNINNAGGAGDGSTFQFLSTPVLLDTITNGETNAWTTYGGPATGLFASTYTTARSAVLYVEHEMNLTAGFAGEIYYQFRRNNVDTAFKSNRLKTGAGYTSAYGSGNQVIVPLDYNNRSFDYYLYANSGGSDSGTITLIGYLT